MATPKTLPVPEESVSGLQLREAIPLFLVLFVIAMGFGIVVPILPMWARRLGATPFMLGIITASYAAVRVVFEPIWGRHSDKVGRKPLLIVGVCGLAASFLGMGFAPNYAVLLLSRTGGALFSSAALPSARALLADLSGPEGRSQAMGLMGAAMGAGFALGPMIGGLLIPVGPTAPFFAGTGLALFTALLTSVLVKEVKERGEIIHGQEVQISLVASVRRALTSTGARFYWLSFVRMFAHTGLMTVLVYLMVDRFGVGGVLTGLAFTVIGAGSSLIQGLAVGPITRRFGDHRTIMGGLVVGAIGYLLLAGSPWLLGLFLAVLIIAVANGLLQPTVISALSKVTPLDQGVTMGLQGTFRQAGMMVGPLWAGWTYSLHRSVPFVSAALFFVLVCAFLSFTGEESGSLPTNRLANRLKG